MVVITVGAGQQIIRQILVAEGQGPGPRPPACRAFRFGMIALVKGLSVFDCFRHIFSAATPCGRVDGAGKRKTYFKKESNIKQTYHKTHYI